MAFRGRLLWLILWPALIIGVAPAAPPPADGKAQGEVSFNDGIRPFLKSYCQNCHGGLRPRGKLSFDGYRDDANMSEDRKIWEKVARALRAHDMPPEDRKQPKTDEVSKITAWIDRQLAEVEKNGIKDPGRVTLRRLNRIEYNNTIRDLIGIDLHPADDFPADDVGYGFDNIGDVLSMPPILMEKYMSAAEKIVAAAFSRPEIRQRILIRQPKANDLVESAHAVLDPFATRAFRRPVKPEESDRLIRIVQLAEAHGDSFELGIQLALRAVLSSPHFIFRVELDPKPRNPFAIHPINDYELAARLSYFLWSSMPDDALFEHAAKGTLRQNLESQTRRMIADPKAKALVENFAGQWLQTRNLKTATPDPAMYRGFDEDLRAAMLKETELFFEAVLKEGRSILDFIDADFTFVNERLARHYGIDGVWGNEFHRVTLLDGQRGGVLAQASILTANSNPTRTSPVKRGKWILENILGTPPPPPPPDAGELNESQQAVLSGSLRQRMEQHRSKADCAVCHQKMDPLGFGFENFDGIGAWRTKDSGFPIDSSGVLPGGKAFQGPGELKKILLTQKDAFARCLTEKMLTYALGRGIEDYDTWSINQIMAGLARDKYKLSALVIEIVKSDPFQKRRGQKGDS